MGSTGGVILGTIDWPNMFCNPLGGFQLDGPIQKGLIKTLLKGHFWKNLTFLLPSLFGSAQQLAQGMTNIFLGLVALKFLGLILFLGTGKPFNKILGIKFNFCKNFFKFLYFYLFFAPATSNNIKRKHYFVCKLKEGVSDFVIILKRGFKFSEILFF